MDDLPDLDLPDLLPPLTLEADAPAAPEAGGAAAVPGSPAPPEAAPTLEGHLDHCQGPALEAPDLPEMDVPASPLGTLVNRDAPDLTETQGAGTSPYPPALTTHEAGERWEYQLEGLTGESPSRDSFRPAAPFDLTAPHAPGREPAPFDLTTTAPLEREADAFEGPGSYSLGESGGRLDRLADALEELVRKMGTAPPGSPPHAPSPPPTPRPHSFDH